MQCVPLILSKVLIPCTLEMEEEHEQAKRPVHVPPTEHLYFVYHQSTQHILNPVPDKLFFLQCLYSFVKEQNTISIFPTLLIVSRALAVRRIAVGTTLPRIVPQFARWDNVGAINPYLGTLNRSSHQNSCQKNYWYGMCSGKFSDLTQTCFPVLGRPSVQLQFYPVLFPHLSQCTSFSAVWQFLLSWAQLFELLFSDAWTRILRFASLASCCCPSWHSSTGKQIKSLCGRDLSGCPATGSVLTWAMKDTLVGWVI